MKKKSNARVRHNPKAEGRPRKIGVERGYGPRHGANAKEGDEVSTDTVPAMLTPREAVLNRNAAELAGRGNIEKLNARGNELAARGVDLAQEGEEDVPYPMRLPPEGADAARADEQMYRDKMLEDLDERMRGRGTPPLRQSEGDYNPRRALPSMQEFNAIAGGGAKSALWRQLYEKYRGTPYWQMIPDFLKVRAEQGVEPQLAQEGESDMEKKTKKLQGGDAAVKPNYWPGGSPPEQIGGLQSPQPGLAWQHKRNMAAQGPGLDWQRKRAAAVAGGQDQPLMPPGAGPFQTPDRGWQPMQVPVQGGSFYPPKGPFAMAGGTEEVPQGPIGTPPVGEEVYGAPIQLTAPDLKDLLSKAGKEQGLSAGQIAGLAKAFSGFQQGYGAATGQPYDELGGQYASFTGGTPGGYQGGISDLGYAPGIAPNAVFHGDKGGWFGPLDPLYSYTGYARGTGDVPGLYRGENDFRGGGPSTIGRGGTYPPIGGVDIPPANMGDPFGGRRGELDPQVNRMLGFASRPWGGGAPGFPWSPTMIPTTYNPQGYPRAVPAGPDWNRSGPPPHTPKKNKE